MLKKLIIFIIPILSFSQSNEIEKTYPLLSVDIPPLFNNCLNNQNSDKKQCFEESIKNHIIENLRFPNDSYFNKEGGRVFANFIFDKTGEISNIDVKGPNKSLENEVIRVINLIPNLFPAQKDGINVNVSYALPVDFFLLAVLDSNQITIKKGSTVYKHPSFKSSPIYYTTNEIKLNASRNGNFWLIELNVEGINIGYVHEDDVLKFDNVKKKKYDDNDSKLAYKPKQNKLENEPNKKIINQSDLKQDLIKNEEILPIIDEELILQNLQNDLDNLDYFKDKLSFQNEINRKIYGYNESDLYYTKALKEFIKILENDINIKYTMLSIENPELFYNTIFKVNKIKLSQKKVQRLKNKNSYISDQFINKNFYSFPRNSNIERLNELINGLKNIEYLVSTDIEINNIIDEKENNFSDILNNEIEEIKDSKVVMTDFDNKKDNEDANLNNTVQTKSPTESYVKRTVVNDYGISGLRSETKEVYEKNQNTPDRRNIKTTIVKPSQENIIEKNTDNKVFLENYEVSVNEAKEKLRQLTSLYNQDLISKELFEESSIKFKEIIRNESQVSIEEAKEKLRQLTSLYNQDLISKELYEESSAKFKEIIQSESKLSVDEAKEKLRQLTSLYNQDLISKELFEESSTKFKLLIEIDSINKLKSLEVPDITDDEALERLKTLKSLYDQELIDKETYDSSTEILKKIILGN